MFLHFSYEIINTIKTTNILEDIKFWKVLKHHKKTQNLFITVKRNNVVFNISQKILYSSVFYSSLNLIIHGSDRNKRRVKSSYKWKINFIMN